MTTALPGRAPGPALVGYGPSYMAGVGASEPYRRFLALVADAWGVCEDNRATSGATAVETFYDASTDARGFRWEPGTPAAAVLVEPVVNCAQLFGPDPRGMAAMLHSTRALVALLRAQARVDPADSSFAYGGDWHATAGLAWGLRFHPAGRATFAADASCTLTFDGTGATLVLVARDAPDGEPRPGRIAVSLDGEPERIHDLRDKAISYVPGSEDGAYGARIAVAPYPLVIQGLSTGRHTLRVRNLDAGCPLLVDGALQPSATPPRVVLIQDADRPDWSTSAAGGSNAVQADYNALLWTVADEFGDGVDVVAPDPAWDVALHTDIAVADGKHPSDLGHAAYAARILARLRGA